MRFISSKNKTLDVKIPDVPRYRKKFNWKTKKAEYEKMPFTGADRLFNILGKLADAVTSLLRLQEPQSKGVIGWTFDVSRGSDGRISSMKATPFSLSQKKNTLLGGESNQRKTLLGSDDDD